MNGLIRVAYLGAMLLLCSATFAQSPSGPPARLEPDQPLPRAELEAFIDGILIERMQEDHIAGVSVAVVQNGSVVLTKGYGFASLDPSRAIDPDTSLFRIGSITKTFTWIEVMKLVEAGRLKLDDPVNQHLPAALRVPDEGFAKPIRVRDLMTHQPGFEDSVLGHLFERDPAQLRPLQRYLEEQRPHRVREPGVLSSYSNYGVGIAGAIIENLTGQRWQDRIEADILKPLGLTHITGREPYPKRNDLPAPMPDSLAKQLAGSFVWDGTGYQPQPFVYNTHLAPAGVISASATSMARYMLMLLNDGSLDGVQIYGEQAAKAFRTPMTSLPATVGNWNAGFAASVMPGGFRAHGHDGGILTNFSNMVLVPELRLGVFISANTTSGAKLTSLFANRIVEYFYSSPQAPPTASPDVFKDRAVYAGEYLNTRRSQHGLEGFLMSLLSLSVSVTPEGYVLLTGPGGSQRFVRQGGDSVLRATDGSAAIAVQVDGGQAQRLLFTAAALERASFWQRSSTLEIPALLTGLAAIAILLGLFYRHAPMAHNVWQARALHLRTVVAIAWLACVLLLGLWVIGALSDQAYAVYEWPHPILISGVSIGLIAALGSAALLALLPLALAGERTPKGWGLWRRARFTYTVVVFVAFALVLALRGGLQPWNP